jgi:hypothetical protein
MVCPSTFVMVRSREFKWVLYKDSPSRELYDMTRDPNELKNLAFDPDYAQVAAEHEKERELYMADKGDR